MIPGKESVVKLQPWGVVTGQLVDDDGKPATGFSLGNGPAPETFDPDRGWLPVNRRIEIDRDGRFRLERLVPGLSYTIYAEQPIQLLRPDL